MKNNRGRKGQVFAIVLVILLLAVVAIALLSFGSSRLRTSPTVQEAYWQVNDQRVTTTSVGDEVEAHVIVKASEEYAGTIVLKIRKDVAFWFDSDYNIKTIPVNMAGGETTELSLQFTPNQVSGGNFRGYFVEVDFVLTGKNWVMESSYPPRLRANA